MIKLFDHWVRGATLVEAFGDFAFVILGFVIGVMWIGNRLPVNATMMVIYAVLLGATVLTLNAFMGLYARIHTRSFYQTRARAVLSLHLAVPLSYGIYSILPMTTVNPQFFELSAMAAVFGMLVNRLRSYHSPPLSLLVNRVMIFGTGGRALEVARIITNSDRNVVIVGFYPSPGDEEALVAPDRILPRSKPVSETAHALDIDEIVVAVSERRGGGMLLRELLDCKLYGVKVLDLASHFEQSLGQIRLDGLNASWLIFGDGFRQHLIRRVTKRVFDTVCSALLLTLTLPVMLLTAAAIAIESGFPIFYRQERVGLNGRVFNVIKFRSMRTDAEKDGKPRWAAAKDDRVTRIGRIIRKLRIDELPQLFSVLVGHMSLVGPRPERPFFVEKLKSEIPFYAVRHSVKPGVTGWAQVRYHYGASMEDAAAKLQYDLYYVKNHALFLDVVILFETVAVVLTAKGAQ